MKIIILGAGQVGGTLAEHLADEKNDITVVDEQATTLKRLQERLDIRTVLGNGAHPVTLMNAGAEDADMLIAVTDSDESNAPFGKIKHLQRARVSNELLDIARHQLLGADDDVDGYRP